VSAAVVEIWQRNLLVPTDDYQRLRSLLSGDELARADRFRLERDRRRFVVARASLRLLLSHYVGIAPRMVVLEYGPTGKPRLAAGISADLEFNVAHAQELAVFAFARDLQVGIDGEWLEEITELAGLAERVFTSGERASLQRYDGSERALAFFRGWTRKEAYLKARGFGLSAPPHQIAVSLEPCPRRVLLADGYDDEPVELWHFASFVPQHGYLATVAARAGHEPLRVVTRGWEEINER
jgi:4'-phosphopantetheinyl transferase